MRMRSICIRWCGPAGLAIPYPLVREFPYVGAFLSLVCACDHFFSGIPAKEAKSISIGRLALVPCHPFAGHRAGSERASYSSGPVYLCSPCRNIYHDRLGCRGPPCQIAPTGRGFWVLARRSAFLVASLFLPHKWVIGKTRPPFSVTVSALPKTIMWRIPTSG